MSSRACHGQEETGKGSKLASWRVGCREAGGPFMLLSPKLYMRPSLHDSLELGRLLMRSAD
jgi:hypothetical protein